MKNKILDKKLIKAMTVGLSASMALQPVATLTVYAENGEIRDTPETTLEADSAKGTLEVTQSINEDAHKEIDEAQDAIEAAIGADKPAAPSEAVIEDKKEEEKEPVTEGTAAEKKTPEVSQDNAGEDDKNTNKETSKVDADLEASLDAVDKLEKAVDNLDTLNEEARKAVEKFEEAVGDDVQNNADLYAGNVGNLAGDAQKAAANVKSDADDAQKNAGSVQDLAGSVYDSQAAAGAARNEAEALAVKAGQEAADATTEAGKAKKAYDDAVDTEKQAAEDLKAAQDAKKAADDAEDAAWSELYAILTQNGLFDGDIEELKSQGIPEETNVNPSWMNRPEYDGDLKDAVDNANKAVWDARVEAGKAYSDLRQKQDAANDAAYWAWYFKTNKDIAQRQADTADAVLKALVNESGRLGSEIKTLEGKLDTAKEEAEAAKQEFEEAAKNLVEKTQAQAAAQKKYDTAKKNHDDAKKVLDDASKTNADAKGSLEKAAYQFKLAFLSLDKDGIDNEVKRLQAEVVALQEKYNAAAEAYKTSQDNLDKANKAFKAAENALNNATTEKNNADAAAADALEAQNAASEKQKLSADTLKDIGDLYDYLAGEAKELNTEYNNRPWYDPLDNNDKKIKNAIKDIEKKQGEWKKLADSIPGLENEVNKKNDDTISATTSVNNQIETVNNAVEELSGITDGILGDARVKEYLKNHPDPLFPEAATDGSSNGEGEETGKKGNANNEAEVINTVLKNAKDADANAATAINNSTTELNRANALIKILSKIKEAANDELDDAVSALQDAIAQLNSEASQLEENKSILDIAEKSYQNAKADLDKANTNKAALEEKITVGQDAVDEILKNLNDAYSSSDDEQDNNSNQAISKDAIEAALEKAAGDYTTFNNGREEGDKIEDLLKKDRTELVEAETDAKAEVGEGLIAQLDGLVDVINNQELSAQARAEALIKYRFLQEENSAQNTLVTYNAAGEYFVVSYTENGEQKTKYFTFGVDESTNEVTVSKNEAEIVQANTPVDASDKGDPIGSVVTGKCKKIESNGNVGPDAPGITYFAKTVNGETATVYTIDGVVGEYVTTSEKGKGKNKEVFDIYSFNGKYYAIKKSDSKDVLNSYDLYNVDQVITAEYQPQGGGQNRVTITTTIKPNGSVVVLPYSYNLKTGKADERGLYEIDETTIIVSTEGDQTVYKCSGRKYSEDRKTYVEKNFVIKINKGQAPKENPQIAYYQTTETVMLNADSSTDYLSSSSFANVSKLFDSDQYSAVREASKALEDYDTAVSLNTAYQYAKAYDEAIDNLNNFFNEVEKNEDLKNAISAYEEKNNKGFENDITKTDLQNKLAKAEYYRNIIVSIAKEELGNILSFIGEAQNASNEGGAIANYLAENKDVSLPVVTGVFFNTDGTVKGLSDFSSEELDALTADDFAGLTTIADKYLDIYRKVVTSAGSKKAAADKLYSDSISSYGCDDEMSTETGKPVNTESDKLAAVKTAQKELISRRTVLSGEDGKGGIIADKNTADKNYADALSKVKKSTEFVKSTIGLISNKRNVDKQKAANSYLSCADDLEAATSWQETKALGSLVDADLKLAVAAGDFLKDGLSYAGAEAKVGYYDGQLKATKGRKLVVDQLVGATLIVDIFAHSNLRYAKKLSARANYRYGKAQEALAASREANNTAWAKLRAVKKARKEVNDLAAAIKNLKVQASYAEETATALTTLETKYNALVLDLKRAEDAYNAALLDQQRATKAAQDALAALTSEGAFSVVEPGSPSGDEDEGSSSEAGTPEVINLLAAPATSLASVVTPVPAEEAPEVLGVGRGRSGRTARRVATNTETTATDNKAADTSSNAVTPATDNKDTTDTTQKAPTTNITDNDTALADKPQEEGSKLYLLLLAILAAAGVSTEEVIRRKKSKERISNNKTNK